MKPERATINGLHKGFRHGVFYDFRDGASVLSLCRRHSLTRTVVEAIIRDHVTHNAELHSSECSEAERR